MRSYSGWATADVTQFQNYLVNIYYPMQHQFLTSHNDAYITNYWANWDLANLEGMMGVGIFADRQDIYDEAVNYLYHGGGTLHDVAQPAPAAPDRAASSAGQVGHRPR